MLQRVIWGILLSKVNKNSKPAIKGEKGIMSSRKALQKWTLVLLPALVLVYIAVDKMLLTPDHSATLTWAAPTLNELNEPLTDLVGYNIHCWADAGRYTYSFHVNDPAITRYELNELRSGTYSCAISAVNADGDESALSNVVAKYIP